MDEAPNISIDSNVQLINQSSTHKGSQRESFLFRKPKDRNAQDSNDDSSSDTDEVNISNLRIFESI